MQGIGDCRLPRKVICESNHFPRRSSTLAAHTSTRPCKVSGAGYFRSGAVHRLRVSGGIVTAAVEGTRLYRVQISYQAAKRVLHTACTCPYMDEFGGPCKHLWAVLLAASVRGWLDEVRHGDLLDVVSDSDLDDADHSARQFGGTHPERLEDDDPPARKPVISIAPLKSWPPKTKKKKSSDRKPARQETWKSDLKLIGEAVQASVPRDADGWLTGNQIYYIVDAAVATGDERLTLEIAYRHRKMDGEWSKLRPANIPRAIVLDLPDPADRDLLTMLGGTADGYDSYGYRSVYSGNSSYLGTIPSTLRLPPALQRLAIPRMCETGRCLLRRDQDDPQPSPLTWDSGQQWALWLDMQPTENGEHYVLAASLRRQDQRMALAQPVALTAGGLLLTDQVAARFDHRNAYAWVTHLRSKDRQIRVSRQNADAMLEMLLSQPHVPHLDLPLELRYETAAVTPQPLLYVKASSGRRSLNNHIEARLSFNYDGVVVAMGSAQARFFKPQPRRMVERDGQAERVATAQLEKLGFRKYKMRHPGGVLRRPGPGSRFPHAPQKAAPCPSRRHPGGVARRSRRQALP